MINCVAVDDEPLALEVLKIYISKIPELNLIASFIDPIEALEYLQKNSIQLLFLDVLMPRLNGFQLVQALLIKPQVIFTTAHNGYAVEAFDIDAVDYLLKPFNFLRFQTAVNKASSRHRAKEKEDISSQHLHIHSDYKILKLAFNEILYIEALDDYVKVHTLTQSFITLLSMKKILDKLPSTEFIRIHRSYIIAKDRISFLQYRKIGLVNNIELPIGDTYRKAISDLKKENN